MLLALGWLACTPTPTDSGPACQALTGVLVDDGPEPSPLSNVPLFAESVEAPGTPIQSVSDAQGGFSLALSEGPWEVWGEESAGCPGERVSVDVGCENAPLTVVVQLCG